MLDRTIPDVLPLADMPAGVFFRVHSADPSKVSQSMIIVQESELPPWLQHSPGDAALFVVIDIARHKGRSTLVLVGELDFDLPPETGVVRVSPVGEAPNGAHVSLRCDYDGYEKPSKIGRIGEDGTFIRLIRTHELGRKKRVTRD